MGDLFNRIGQAVGKIVHWVNAPGVTGPVMIGLHDSIDDRVPHNDVG